MSKNFRPGARGGWRLFVLASLFLPLSLSGRPSPAPKPSPAPSAPAPSAPGPSGPGSSAPAPPAPGPSAPVPVHVAGIQPVGPDQVLLFLADEKEEKAVPISVGRDQGLAIFLGRERAQTPRPMTHDLIVEILKDLDARVEKVTITELKEDTYYSEITLRSGKTLHAIDARPSDAIALAVRLDTPIFAAPGLLRLPPGPEKPPSVPASQRAPRLNPDDGDRGVVVRRGQGLKRLVASDGKRRAAAAVKRRLVSYGKRWTWTSTLPFVWITA